MRVSRSSLLATVRHPPPRLLVALVVAAAATVLPVLYGLVPLGGVSHLGTKYWALGLVDCLASYDAWIECPSAALPSGYRPGFGLPFAIVASGLVRLLGIGALPAYNLVGALYLVLGMAGMAFVGRRLGLGWPLALAAGWLFLSLPITYDKAGYTFLMWGFVAAPLSLAADLWLLDREGPPVAAVGVSAVKVFGLFGEPYSFVITSVFSLFAVILFAARSLRGRYFLQLWRPLWIALSLLLAVSLYKAYIPGGADYHVMSLDYFRGQGIDLIAFLARTTRLHFFSLPLLPTDLRALDFFTDGEMVRHSFMGLSLLTAVVAGPVLARAKSWPLYALVASAALCFVLALGPALKADSRRAQPLPADHSIISVEDYRMPREAAVYEFPWAGWFRRLPAVNVMRAVSRWQLMVQLFASLAAMLLLQHLLRRRRGLAIVFLALLVAEQWPDLGRVYHLHGIFGRHLQRFSDEVVAELDDLVTEGETVLFVEASVKAEYLSLYLCAEVGCRSYNASTDKGLDQARRQWPAEIAEVAARPTLDSLRTAFAGTDLRTAVVPLFDLRWNSYSWKSDMSPDGERRALAKRLSASDLETVTGRWFAVIRPRSQAERGPAAPPTR